MPNVMRNTIRTDFAVWFEGAISISNNLLKKSLLKFNDRFREFILHGKN
jgi:hypothetical protein